MRKLGEQWVEEIDGKKHMLKAVEPFELCQGCLFNCNYGCCWLKCFDSCHMGNYFIIKDLGILNEDGCLPAPWDETKYPKITVLIGNVYNIEVMKGHWFMQVRGDTLEKAVERWNRRA